jgi:hypothetical protein
VYFDGDIQSSLAIAPFTCQWGLWPFYKFVSSGIIAASKNGRFCMELYLTATYALSLALRFDSIVQRVITQNEEHMLNEVADGSEHLSYGKFLW